MPTTHLAGSVGVVINGASSGQRLGPDYAWYDAANADLSPTAIAGPPPIGPVGGPGDGPNLLAHRETGNPFGSEQNKMTYSGALPPGVLLVQKEVRAESPPGFNPWPVGVQFEFGFAGVPTTPGVYTVTVNPSSHTGSFGYPGGDFEWTIALVGGCPLITIDPDTLEDGLVGKPVSIQFEASNGVAPYVWDLAFGALPDGLTLSSGGLLSGTPTTEGEYSFTIRATDDNGCPGVVAFSGLAIELPGPIIVFPETVGPLARNVLPDPEILFTATGGIGAPYVFEIPDSEGELPPGLELHPDGTVTGFPNRAGLFNVTIRATDGTLAFGEREYDIQVTGLRITIDDGGGPVDVGGAGELSECDLDLTLNRQSTGRITFGDGYIPPRNGDVVIYARDGITPIFDGLVLTRQVGGMSASNPANAGDADLVDYSIYFDDAIVSLEYLSPVELEDVIADIVAQSLTVYGITYTPTDTYITLDPFTWTEVKVSDAFKRISDATGVVFRELPLKTLDVFVPLDAPAPVTITDAEINASDLSWRDGSNLTPNTVDLLCGPSGQGIADQQWISDGAATEWEVDIQAVLGNAEPARASHGFLGTTGNFAAAETVTLGASTYTFRASLVGDVAGEVLIGATEDDSLENLIAAITNAGGSGYAPSTPVNASATAYLRNPSQLAANALTPGVAGNSIAVSTTGVNALWYGEGAIPISALQLGNDASGVAGWTQGYVLENGAVAQPVGGPGSGAYYEWDVTDGRGTISIGGGTTAPAGTTLELKYLAEYPFHAIFSVGVPPAAPITYRETHPEISIYSKGLELAEQIYNREAAGHRELEIQTEIDGFLPGQALTVDTTYRGGIDDVFLVAAVRIQIVNDEIWNYRITAQESEEYQGSHVEQWKKLVGGGTPGGATPAALEAGGAIGAGDIYSDGRTPFAADQSMGGNTLEAVADPVAAQDAATKAYVDAAAPPGNVIFADGSVDFTGPQSMGGNAITDLDDPTNAQDAATRAYVLANAGGSAVDCGFFGVGGGAAVVAAGPILVKPTGTTLTFIVGIGIIGTGDATVYANVQLTDLTLDDNRAVVNNSLVSFGGQHLFGLVHITGLTAGKQYLATLMYASRRAAAALAGGPGPSSPFLVCLDMVTTAAAASLETAQASSSATFVDLATAGPSVTATPPTNGVVAVLAGDSENRVQTGTSSLGIDVSSGNTLAAAVFTNQSTNGAQNMVLQGGLMLARLANSSTVFKLQYASDGGSNTRYARWIAVLFGEFGGTPVTFGISQVFTTESTTSTSYTGLTTADSVTLTTGTSVLVLFSVNTRGSGALDVSVAVDVSGATTTAAADGVSNAKNITAATQTWHVGRGVVMTVNAGSNTFKLKYKVSGGTGSFLGRVLAVIRLN